MGNFIKQNWFKIIITIAVLIVALSVGYYFVSKTSKPNQTMSKEEVLLNQQSCANQASKTYAAEGYKPGTFGTSYVDYYNQKLNKCFIEIYDRSSGLFSMYLMDAYELKDYADYTYFSNGNNGAANPVCDVDEQISDISARADCNSQADFENYIKSYMEN
jgi:hypothetical protein